MEFFLFSLISTLYQTWHSQSKLKTWYVLFWCHYGSGRLNHNRTVRGRPRGVLCRLISYYLYQLSTMPTRYARALIWETENKKYIYVGQTNASFMLFLNAFLSRLNKPYHFYPTRFWEINYVQAIQILRQANIQFQIEEHISRTAFLTQKRRISVLCINSKLKLNLICSF